MKHDPNSLGILSLEIENILRLKVAHIVPKGRVVTLTGDNEAGKSSVLNSIAMVFGGADFVPERPIRDGASKGEINIDLGDLKACLKFSASGGKTMTLTAKDGTPIKRPAEVLKSFWTKMADPIEFIRLSNTTEGRRKQADVLRQLLNIDFSALDAERKRVFDERTKVNGELESAKVLLARHPFDESAPEQIVSVQDLVADLEKAQAHNKTLADKDDEISEWKDGVTEATESIDDWNKKIVELEKELENAKVQRDGWVKNLNTRKEQLAKLQKEREAMVPADEDAIRNRITDSENVNARVRNNHEHQRIKELIKTLSDASDRHTRRIEAIDAEKVKTLEQAKFPMPGLSFDDNNVLLNGIPFAQGSQAQQLKAAVAIGIALNPRIKVILIRDASLFDDKSLAAIEQMANEHGYQIWLECVKSDNPSAVLIEEGEVVEK